MIKGVLVSLWGTPREGNKLSPGKNMLHSCHSIWCIHAKQLVIVPEKVSKDTKFMHTSTAFFTPIFYLQKRKALQVNQLFTNFLHQSQEAVFPATMPTCCRSADCSFSLDLIVFIFIHLRD